MAKAKAKTRIGNQLPLRITPCPIKEAIIELRFESNLDFDFTLSVIRMAMSKFLPGFSPERLPIADLPFDLRENDKNLKYQAYYKYTTELFTYLVGPRALVISTTGDYPGWTKLSSEAQAYFKIIKNQQPSIIKEVVRVGMRYLTVLEGNRFNDLNILIKLNDTHSGEEYNMLDESINFRTVIQRENNSVRLQLTNMIEDYDGTMIDIDVSTINSVNFLRNPSIDLEKMHSIEKKLFFGLLKPNFLKTLAPEYEKDDNEISI